MKDLVIGDIHFGIKTNSQSWLEQQIDFIYKEVFTRIDSHDRVIFLGDLFDIRYSINTYIGCEVKKMVRKMLSQHPDKEFYFIAGNHDFYSPMIEFEEYNAYELCFGEEFTSIYKNLHIIACMPLLTERTLMLPWYFTEDADRYESVMKEYQGQYDIIYCHSDLESWSIEKTAMKGNAKVYSGHIHYPYINKEAGLYNIGASCAFTFNDVNSQRYIYTIEDGDIKEAYENVITPRFHRYYNERIFNLTKADFHNAFTQLCISSSNINKSRYIEQIKSLMAENTDCVIKTVVIDDDVTEEMEYANINTNIHEYIRDNMPEHLKAKYEILDEKMKNN